MKCCLERNSRIYDILFALQEGYESGNFEKLFPYLATDCVMESQWVLTPNTGYDVIVDYFTEKGKTLAKNDIFPECSIVELTGNCNPVKINEAVVNGLKKENVSSVGIMYENGKFCLLIRQTIDGETDEVIADVKIDDNGMVKRIDLCMPELFQYREPYSFVEFVPAVGETETETALIRIGEFYYGELYLFLLCAGKKFDEFSNIRISMENWCTALEYWKAFMTAKSFDEAFELTAGVDYEKGTVEYPDRGIVLGKKGKRIWENRKESSRMLNKLFEWTALYENSHDYINIYGW